MKLVTSILCRSKIFTNSSAYSTQNFLQEQLHIVLNNEAASVYANSLKKKLLLLLPILAFTTTSAQFQYNIIIRTQITATPVNPVISQYVSSGKVISTVTNIGSLPDTMLFYGKLVCLSPSQFTISLSPNYIPKNQVTLNKGAQQPLTIPQQMEAFGNFDPNNLYSSDISIDSLKDPNNTKQIKLPDGTYRICFYALPPHTCDGPCGSDPNQGCSNFFTIVTCSQPPNGALLNTTISPQVNPIISQTILGGGVTATIQTNIPAICKTLVKLFGKIERTAPSPFTIMLKDQYASQQTVALNQGITKLNPTQLMGAFGNFDLGNLDISGIDLASVTDPDNPKNIKLPDGNYNICFYARYFNGITLGNYASDPNLGCSNNFTLRCAPPNGVQITTAIQAPFNPIIDQMIQARNLSATLQTNIASICNTEVKLFGKIECFSPSPFTIMTDTNKFIPQQSIKLTPGQTLLSVSQLREALGNFNENNLAVSGINLASITDANHNIKLPDGNYRICFYARYYGGNTLGSNASDINIGCGNFNICYKAGAAPQFTQPVSNVDINSPFALVRPASTVTFTWIPPQSTCGLPPGGYRYDFEMWEILDNQTVTDALNNPFVFRKTSLPSTTFLLDTNLYKNILQKGKRYAIRVRATSADTLRAPVEIENNGYSRVEAFQYGGSVNNTFVQNGIIDPQFYFIPFKERKSDFWDDVFALYPNSDTLVPINQFIAFSLTQTGIAYNLDAIELFLALNSELTNMKEVKLSYHPNLPIFPKIAESDQRKFDTEHAIDLQPNPVEENKFNKYLDSLIIYQQNLPDNAAKMISDLINGLKNFKEGIDTVNRVSVNLTNSVLSELLYNLRLYSKTLNKTELNQLQNLVSTLQELITLSPNSTSLLYPSPANKSSLSSYQSNTVSQHSKQISFVKYSITDDEFGAEKYASVIDQVLPLDIIVWHYSNEPPRPVSDAPDLTAVYRVFY